MTKSTETSKSSNPNSPTRYYRAAEAKAKKPKPIVHEVTNRDRLHMEEQRQRMLHRDLLDRGSRALDEDSQLCQEYYASAGAGRYLPVDIDYVIDLL